MEFINYTNKYDGGIYNIVNLVNGKIYIGSARNFVDRLDNHVSDLRNNKHGNGHLQASFNIYGEENFIFKIAKVFNTDDDLERTTLEQKFINQYLDKWDECYNIAKSAIQNFSKGGYRHKIKHPTPSDEVKQKIRNTKLEYYQTEEGQQLIKKLSLDKLGKTYEELYGVERAAEIRKDISEKKLIQMNQEHMKENLRQLLTGVSFEKRFGVEKAKLTKEKISKGRKGKVAGDQHPRFKVIENIKLQAPDGTIYTRVYGISLFAKEHGLKYSSFTYLLQGKLKSHRGWKLIN
jgi:group I intron endonuclease